MRRAIAMFSAAMLMFAFAAYSAVAAIGRPPAPAAGERARAPVVVRIVSPVVVMDENVQLGKIGEIQTARSQDRENLLELSVARMPEGKDSIQVPAHYIQSRVREILGADRDVVFEIPAVVELRRQTRHLTSQRFLSEVEKLAREGEKIPEGVEMRAEAISFPETATLAPDAKLEITVPSAGAEWQGPLLFKIRITDSTGSRELLARARIRWFAKRWTSVRQLSFKTALTPEDFELTELELTPAKNPPMLAKTKEELATFLDGAYAMRAVAKGAALLESQIGRDPDIQRGQKLKVVITSESGLRVVANGEAMKNARIGSVIKARLERNGRIVSGQLVEKDRMEIGL